MTGAPRHFAVVGASALGTDFALAAREAGNRVTLLDEHPQSLKQMSFDAPWFYGAALPAALTNENAIAQAVTEADPALFACLEAGVDLRLGTVVWGAFQNGPNSRHIGAPKLGLASATGNEMLEYDHLVLATGTRDFVPSFTGWDLPGVFGVKGGLALLDSYQCYEGKRTLVLGTSPIAVRFAERALARGVRIVGMVEPSDRVQAGPAAAAHLAALGIAVQFGAVIEAALGKSGVARARIVSLAGGAVEVACDTICMAIGTLPNIELAAAMGCALHFDTGLGAWVPQVDAAGATSLTNVTWLSAFGPSDKVQAALAAIEGQLVPPQPAPGPATQGDYLRLWVQSLLKTGGGNVTLCQCESVTRDAFLSFQPPAYLNAGLRHPQTPVSGALPLVHQDQMKRLTRVGMGHCQGRRCRDETALLISVRFGLPVADIQPGSFRFPVRPLPLDVISAQDDTPDTRDKWSYWLHTPEVAAGYLAPGDAEGGDE